MSPFQKAATPPNGYASSSTVKSVFLRNNNSTEGSRAVSYFQNVFPTVLLVVLSMAVHTRATVQKGFSMMPVQRVKNIMSERAWIWWTFIRADFQLWLPWKHWDGEDAVPQGSFVLGICLAPGASANATLPETSMKASTLHHRKASTES